MDIHRSILWASLDIRLVSTTFKIKNLFNVKDAVPEGLRTRVAYKFSCASCNACYVGETSRHFSTRVREHLLWQVFWTFLDICRVQSLVQCTSSCRTSCTLDYFQILDSGVILKIPSEAQWIYVHKMEEPWPQPAGETQTWLSPCK